ncbi:hypothetical protein K0B03_04525 [Patescibacteria group bacterium]|nr:hypothetical protein [Patescibacteria group bacterium]
MIFAENIIIDLTVINILICSSINILFSMIYKRNNDVDFVYLYVIPILLLITEFFYFDLDFKTLEHPVSGIFMFILFIFFPSIGGLIIGGVFFRIVTKISFIIMKLKITILKRKLYSANKKIKRKTESLNKKHAKKMRKQEQHHSKIENVLIAFASKNNGIIMKNELTEASGNKYPNKDLLKAINKMREEGIVENQGDSYVFTSLI